MADLLLSLLKTILEAGFNINSALEKAGHNAEDCRRIGALLQTLSVIANAKYLDLEDSTAKGLEVALQRASEIVKSCERKSKTLASRVFKANQIADELRGVCFDILLNLNVAIFANLADIKKTVTENNSLSAQILEICAANIDLLLPQKIDRLPQTYCNSTDDASYQNENKSETTKTDLARPEFKREKDNAPVDSKVQCASLSDGSSKSASLKSVIGQGDPSIVYKIISESIGNMTAVTSIDGHPTKTWIVMSYEGGNVSIWDYQEKKTAMELQVNEVSGKFALLVHGISQYLKETGVLHSVCSAKFIAQGKWLVVGNGDGYICVYDCTDSELKELKKFRAHDNSVDLLAIHPTKPYLLSSSYHGKTIKLWSWTSDSSMDWVPIKTFYVKPTYPDGVRSLKFNPRETNTFACVTYENKVKVGNIKNSSPLTDKPMGAFEADYFFSLSHLHLMVTLSPSDEVQIWDLETSKVYHTLSLSLGGCKITCIACHPTLPILVTTLDDGTVCFWDAITYRLQQRVQITDSHALDLVFMADINDTARLAVKFESTMVIMEVNYFPMENTSQWTDGGNYG